MQFKKTHLMTVFKGAAMGIADLIPGVSGGTIALITGIYDELINSLHAIDKTAIKLFFTGRWVKLNQYINGQFLFFLAIGILFSVLTFASGIRFLLSSHSEWLWSFFFGLILSSFLLLVKKTENKNFLYSVFLMLGIVVALLLSTMTPLNISNPSTLVFFTSGMIAICAMILPGISGSFILVILGVYEAVLNAVVKFDLIILTCFTMGCLIGLFLFSRIVKWLVKNYYTLTIGFLCGLMLGSLYKIWPWKLSILNEQGCFISSYATPWTYAVQKNPEKTVIILIGMSIGFLLVFGLEFCARYTKQKNSLQ